MEKKKAVNEPAPGQGYRANGDPIIDSLDGNAFAHLTSSEIECLEEFGYKYDVELGMFWWEEEYVNGDAYPNGFKMRTFEVQKIDEKRFLPRIDGRVFADYVGELNADECERDLNDVLVEERFML